MLIFDMGDINFHDLMKTKIHNFIMNVYGITNKFPKTELYGTTSQLRRASVSIMLNNVEGYGRKRDKVKLNFYEIAYGSAQECKYLLFLSREMKWVSNEKYTENLKLIEDISKMLWTTIVGIEKKIK